MASETSRAAAICQDAEFTLNKTKRKFFYSFRACPREDQAEVIHAISPISMKLGQIKGFIQ